MSLAELTRIGLRWDPSGHAGLSGPLLALADDCDRAFMMLAGLWDAAEERHPVMLSARDLEPSGHLRSFPHQVTFPICLEPSEANLGAFVDGELVGADGAVALTGRAPVRDVLTPAACHHLYAARRGARLAGPLYLTTRNACFRRERRYEPLRRQWSFTMREIVCLGTQAEAARFLDDARAAVDRLATALDLPLPWAAATDPFFRPGVSPGYLAQRVMPSKHEATYGGDVAVASINLHRDHFGAAFGIDCAGAPAASACVAFGIERWLYALTGRHGTDPTGWPDLVKAARQATEAS
jgi:seryl-tRNA synthetase